MTETIAICNQKGGVGKTTTALNLGVGLSRMGKKVLLVDTDPQGDLGSALGLDADSIENTLATMMYQSTRDVKTDPNDVIIHHAEGVDIIPSNLELSSMENYLVNAMSREKVLESCLKDIKKDYDYVMLFFEMCRILREKQPKCFIAENVKGLLSANGGEAFPLIISEFEKPGYRVKHKLINTAQFGVPQRRERVIIVGIRNDLGFEYEFPDEPCSSEEEYATLRQIVESQVPEKYFFSERAVQGMLNAKKDMNKGRAQDLDKPCKALFEKQWESIVGNCDAFIYLGGNEQGTHTG